MTKYSGPWCTIKFADGKSESVKGSRAEVTAKLNTTPLIELENVYGDIVTVGTQHVVRLDDGDLGAEFEQIAGS